MGLFYCSLIGNGVVSVCPEAENFYGPARERVMSEFHTKYIVLGTFCELLVKLGHPIAHTIHTGKLPIFVKLTVL